MVFSSSYDDSSHEIRCRNRLRLSHPRSAVKPFRYWRDPLFLVACALYALNRWELKPRLHFPFLHDHFNDLLLMPCALPLLLYLQRCLKLRTHDLPPTPGEITLYLAVWSVLFEWLGPHLMPWTTGDPWDVLAYAVGALFSGLWGDRKSIRLHS